jgi:hypothetical protein
MVSNIRDLSEREMVEFETLDTFNLMHDLPSSFGKLQL